MSMPAPRYRFSLDEWHQMIEAGLLRDQHVELPDGEIYEMRPIGPPHQGAGPVSRFPTSRSPSTTCSAGRPRSSGGFAAALPLLGGGRKECAARRATTVGRGTKSPPEGVTRRRSVPPAA